MSQDGETNLSAPQSSHTDPPNAAGHSASGGTQEHATPRVLSTQDCLAGLSQLPGLIAIGMLKPAQANAMRGPFNDILRYHQQAGRTGGAGTVADENVLEMLRQQPELLRFFEGVLTPEQIEMIMREATRDDE